MHSRYYHQLLLPIMLLLGNSLTAQVNTVTLTSGSVWIPPIGCSSFYVEMWGGGAGGNTSFNGVETTTSTGGGRGGSYVKSTVFTVTQSSFDSGYQYSIGSGGSVNNHGGDTWFFNTLCLAPGGRTRTQTQPSNPVNQYVALSYIGGGGGTSLRNIFDTRWHGGGGGAARRLGNGYVGGNASEGSNGGGAEGFAYDNVDVSKGRGGQNGSWTPGAPGGGGAGNQSGANGIIIITYICAFSPGSIGTSHTIPYPQEFAAGTDMLTNLGNPASFGYTAYWQARKENTQWQTIANMGFGLSAVIQDSITRNTYYRRGVTGCGTTNTYTDSVLIKVFTATTGKNGVISGKVTSSNGITGVGGILITAKKTIALKGSPQSHPYTTTTNADGTYVIPDIFYGDRDNGDPASVSFTVVASKPGHSISTILPVTLTYNIPTSSNNNFIDNTVYSVTGTVKQICSSCLPGYQGPYGLGNVKIATNDQTILPVYSDSLNENSIGNFGLAVANPGGYVFTPVFLNHQFDSASRTIDVNSNTTGLDFLDSTTRSISGRLTDVAGRGIGTATLRFECIVKRPDNLPDTTTFKKRTTISTGQNSYSIRLPAGKYRMIVEGFTSAYPVTDDRYITETAVKDFFNTLAVEPFIDVNLKDSVRNLVYHRPPVLKMLGLRDTACNTDAYKNPRLVLRTNIRKRFEAFVYEGPESIGDKVPIFNTGMEWPDSLANYLRFYTNVTKRGATENADTLLFRLNNTLQPQASMIDSFFTPGAPEVVPPFRKPFFVFYFDRYGRRATLSPLTSLPDSATVLGSFSPTNTFTTVSPEIPFLILHQPPGDKSYSFWSKDSSIQTSTTTKVASQNGVDGFANVSIGPKFSYEVGIPGGPSIGIEQEIIATANYTHQNQAINDTLNELLTTTTIKNSFQTNASPLFTPGISGDIYIGNAMNYVLGKSITVDFIPLRPLGQCEIESDSRLFMAPDTVKTEFVYTENYIEKVLIPTQQRLESEATTDSARLYHKTQAKVWREVIDNNILNKKNATFMLNRSFSAGPGVDYSVETSKSSTNTITWETMVSNNFAAELGLYVSGLGASGGVAITLQQTTGGSKSTSSGSTNEIGYHLEDDDQDGNGDYYSVNIKKDPVYGTPVFDLFAGTSSCPPEQGAQNRDMPHISSGDMRFDSLTVGVPKFFTIQLANKSESGEPRNYSLSVDANTGEGLVISASGSTNLVSTPINYYVTPSATAMNVQIKVEKFNPNDGVFSYPDVEFYLSDLCDDGPQVPNSYSTAKISFNYTSPCGGITLAGPADGFVANNSNTNVLPIKISNYNLNNIDSVTLQYRVNRSRGGLPWERAFAIRRADITNATEFTYPWNFAALEDTVYCLRLRMVCANGDVIYSDIISGIIDRELPALLGTPQPTSGIYTPGSSDISFNYSEPIDNSNLNNGMVEMVRRSNNSVVPVTVTAIENKLVVTPVSGLGIQLDSFRVIVRNVTDRYGNIKTTGDTSFFKLGSAAAPVYTGNNIATVHLVPSSITESTTDSIAVYFKLRQVTNKRTKVYFNVSGTALEGADYTVSYDTVKVKRCNNAGCTDFTMLAVPNEFIGYPGYVIIDSNQTQAVLYLHPKADAITESSETVTISLVNGGEYKLQDSVQVTATIIEPAAVCPSNGILYVNSSAIGNNSGSSWQHAMTSLQAALNRNCPGVVQIWVAKGTYKPTDNTNRDSAFQLRNNLAIYGGFAGNEASLNQRNLRMNPTVLSGDIGTANDNSDNSYNVVRNENNGLNNTAMLDGFIITSGNANKGTYTGNRGGAINNRYSAPSFYNCIIRNSNAVEYGGGMFNEGSAPAVYNSVFINNVAVFGGAVYNESASPKLINCTFAGNLATIAGGAMSTYGMVSPQITNGIIWGNSSGIRDAGGSTPAVTYSIVQGGYTGIGNLNVNPWFLDEPVPGLAITGDVRLLPCSPAINVGNNSILPGALSIDLAGNTRIVNSIVDMGAYERQTLTLPNTIYVDANATGNNSGESWANAYTSIRSALTELNYCIPGTTILVAAGIYATPASTTFNFDKLDAVILGGYPAGGGIRNPVVNRSILKGNVQVFKSVKMDGIEVQRQ